MPLGELTEEDVKLNDKDEKPKEAKSLEYHFAVSTSCHGLRNIAQSRHTPVRIFWIIAFLVAFGALVSQIVMLIMQYASFSAVTEIQVVNQKKMAFPAVTVCNYNRLMKSKVEKVAREAGVNTNDLQTYISVGFGDFTWTGSLDNYTAEVEKNKAAMLQVRDRLYQAGYRDYVRLIRVTSYDINDMMIPSDIRCTWSGTPSVVKVSGSEDVILCPPDLFSDVITRYGRCYTFNAIYPEALHQEQAGVGQGFRMWTDIRENEYNEDVELGNHQLGIRVLVHHKEEFPVMETQGLAMSPGVHAYIGIDWTKYINAEPNWGDCKVEPLAYHSRYSNEACRLECTVRYVQEKCNCRPVNLPGDNMKQVCEPLDMLQCVKDAEASYLLEGEPCKFECNPACERDEYNTAFSSVTITSRHIEKRLAKEFNVTANYFRENLVYLDLYFQKMSYILIQQKPGTTFSQLLGNIGGQLGLFIGASVITVSEGVEFLIMKCVFWYRTKKKERSETKSQNQEGEELKKTPAP